MQVPLPPLQAAVFPPQLREQPCPALDLYDLDDEFASERIRLAQLSNKCTPDDLEYYINEATTIVTAGMGDEVPMRHGTAESQAKQALFFIMSKLASWKKLHDDSANQWQGPSAIETNPAMGSMPTGPGYQGIQSPQGGMASPNQFGGPGMTGPPMGDGMGGGMGGGGPQMYNNFPQEQAGDYRPGTAAAIAAVQQMEMGNQQGNFGGDFRPDTAAAIRAVQESSGMGGPMMGGMGGGDFRPDTAAAIAAVQQQFG